MSQADIDFSKRFIINGIFPVHEFADLVDVVDNPTWKVQKTVSVVDGNIVWTYFYITIKPGQHTDPYKLDADTKMTILEGQAWLMILHKSGSGARMVEAGNFVMIPEGATYTLLNQSKNENLIYTLDANTLLQIQ